MGSKSASPGGQMGNLGGLGQGGDVQPFDMPPMQQAPYNPYTMTTDAGMNRQAPPMPQAPYNPYNMTTSAGMNRQASPMQQPPYNPFAAPTPADMNRQPPMPPQVPIERPMLPPEVVEALRLAMQGQTQPPMGQTPMPAPQQRGMPHPVAQSDAPQIARALRIMRGLPVY